MLLVYMAWRLLPAMPSGVAGTAGFIATSLWLVSAAVLITIVVRARRSRRALPARLAAAGWFALGSMSSLFVLTLIRDVVLLIAFVATQLIANLELSQLASTSAI